MKKDELNFLKLTDEDEIRFYEEQGILGESDGYDDSSVEKIALIALFRKAGLSPEQTAEFWALSAFPDRQIRILNRLRRDLLDAMHEQGRLIDRIDFVIYELRQKEKKE